MDNEYSLRTLKRVRYFTGKLLSAEDFNLEQDYWLGRFRRHNRYLHGVGVVTGLEIAVEGDTSAGFKFVISPGYALDSLGREVVVPAAHEEAIAFADKALYICLHYAERQTDPVPVVGGGSEELAEFSRIEESYEVRLEPDSPCTEDGIALSRLKRKKGRWKVDKKFRRPGIKD